MPCPFFVPSLCPLHTFSVSLCVSLSASLSLRLSLCLSLPVCVCVSLSLPCAFFRVRFTSRPLTTTPPFVIFTRCETLCSEARWLPTVICSAKKKLCINTALGFDSYVVMRHGVSGNKDESTEEEEKTQHVASSSPSSSSSSSPDLGCYFCNDVVAPTDSLTARTLDQQCTVTRPGIAPLASALAVELMVAVLHHSDRQFAPADLPFIGSNGVDDHGPDIGPLGAVPHQLRGYLPRYESLPVIGHQFKCCTACSSPVSSTVACFCSLQIFYSYFSFSFLFLLRFYFFAFLFQTQSLSILSRVSMRFTQTPI